MRYPYTFLILQFRVDLENYLNNSSVRKLSERIDGLISPSGISRIVTGKKRDISTVELCAICHVLETSPSDYFERVLF